MSEKLMPCPFCGGAAHCHDYRGGAGYWQVECQDCDATTDGRAIKADAIEVWNRRATHPQSSASPLPEAAEPVWVESTTEWSMVPMEILEGEAPSMTLSVDEVQFLAARVRRICKLGGVPLPTSDDDGFLVSVAGTLLGTAAFNLEHAAPVASRAVQAEPVALPHPGGVEISTLLDSILAEYNWPTNPKNAARAGWTAAMRHLAATTAPASTAEPSEPDVPDIIAGALQCSRGYAYTLMERAIAGRWDEAVTPDRARAASLAPREPLTEEQWYDIACAHATREWNSNGYMESVKSVGLAAINAALGIAASPAGAEGAGS